MPANEDYRKYLEEKFKALQTAQHAYFITAHDSLDSIKKDTLATNSRVNHLEDNVKVIDKDLQEYRMIKKYPKVAIVIIAFAVIAIMFGFQKMTNRRVATVVGLSTDTLRNEIRLRDGVSGVSRSIDGDAFLKFKNDFGIKDSIKLN